MAIFQKRPTKATKSLKSRHSQAVFLKRLGHLLEEGFSIQGALFFLERTGNRDIQYWVQSIQDGLSRGESLHRELAQLNFSDQICSQIYFSVIHGQFAQTISQCGHQVYIKMERQKKLQQLLTYPSMLLVFMVGMLFAMRYILLPHITQLTTSSSDHLGMGTTMVLVLIRESPIIIIIVSLLTVIGIIGFYYYLSTKTAIEKSIIFASVPLVSPLVQLYYTQFLAMEWGQLIQSGIQLREMTEIMMAVQSSPFVKEMGDYISTYLQEGHSLYQAVDDLIFLKEEFSDIIEFGDQSSNLDKELVIYANQCEEELTLAIEKWMTYIQPLVFIGIGLMIIAIYAALLLPTFSLLNSI